MSWRRQDSHRRYFEEGPPRFLRFGLILFVVIGGLSAAVWYNVRQVPTVSAQENRPAPPAVGKR